MAGRAVSLISRPLRLGLALGDRGRDVGLVDLARRDFVRWRRAAGCINGQLVLKCLGLWALAVLYRLPSAQSIGLVTIGIFAARMLATGQVPVQYQASWLGAIARVNPMTPVLKMSRQGFLGPVTWSGTWPGLLALVVTAAVLALLTWASLRRFGRGAR
jgi:hypothetical protein